MSNSTNDFLIKHTTSLIRKIRGGRVKFIRGGSARFLLKEKTTKTQKIEWKRPARKPLRGEAPKETPTPPRDAVWGAEKAPPSASLVGGSAPSTPDGYGQELAYAIPSLTSGGLRPLYPHALC